MNNAIKYILCAGASLAIGFGGGYCFKSEQDKVACQSKAAQFEADSIQYASDSFRQISSDLYSAEQSAAKIHSSLENINKGIQEMDRSYTGGPGLPGDTGFGDLFPGPGYKDIPGLPEDPGFGKLFPGPGKKDSSDEQSSKDKDAMYVPARELTKLVEDAVEHIQSNVERAYMQLNKINKHTESGRKALANAKEISDSISGDVPSVPDIPRMYEDNQKKEEEKK